MSLLHSDITLTSLKMSFEADLIYIVKCYFSAEGIFHEDEGDASDFAAQYFEMRIRRIDPKPRVVHFSDEIHDSLGKLARETDQETKEKALKAWRAVFRIRHLLADGRTVVPYLSRKVNDSTTKDGLLWDFGMHHFHLSEQLGESEFVERSDYLLFAIVAEEDAYFVDVREHQDPENLLWVRQDLLKIVHSNWPDLTYSHVLRGAKGSLLTDNEKQELRRKNVIHVPDLGGLAIIPLGGGTVSDGSSFLGRLWGDKVVHEIERHKLYLYNQLAELKAALQVKGIDTSDEMKFQLVPLDSMELSPEVVVSLQADNCLSRDLSQMGFAIVESKTRLPIAVSLENQP